VSGPVEFVDTTTRDGNQSLWSATGLTTPDVLAIAPTLDEVGYHALDFTSSTHMAVSVRFHREDPWERIRLVSEAMSNTPLGMITTGMRFISWVPADEEVMRLSFRLVARNGIRRFQIADPSNDPARLRHLAAIARAEGIEEVVIGLTYSISEVHTHEYYARHAAALADCEDMDRLYLKDPGGLLTTDAVRELAPHFVTASRGRKTELHSHCTIGLAPLVYVEGVHAGFDVLHTASGALSRGTSQPDVIATVRNLEALGYEHTLDLERQALVSAHFDALGRAKGLPAGAPREFDAAYYRHQLPGGMVTTTRRMLEELRRPELFDAVLEEVGRVRAEMGYPIIVTPVSQFIASQAARNIIDGERWANVSDETVRFFLGHYGAPPAPVDPQIADRVLSRPQAKALAELEPLSLEGARERFGTRISEEELLLRLTMPAEQVDAMVAARDGERARSATAGATAGEHARPATAAASAGERARPASSAAEPDPGRSPLVALLSALHRRPDLMSLSVTAGGDQVVWRRG
jgi:oxaloacetate decarboxylase (Na+ extruding) subunit alpha